MPNGINVGINNSIKSISGINVGVDNASKNVSEVYAGVNNSPKLVWSSVKGNRLFGTVVEPQAPATTMFEISPVTLQVIKKAVLSRIRFDYIGGISKRLFVQSVLTGPHELNQDTFAVINSGSGSSKGKSGPIGGNNKQLCIMSGNSANSYLYVSNPDNFAYIGSGYLAGSHYYFWSIDGLYNNFVYLGKTESESESVSIDSITNLEQAKPSFSKQIFGGGKYSYLSVAGADNKMFSFLKYTITKISEMNYDNWEVIRTGSKIESVYFNDFGGTK